MPAIIGNLMNSNLEQKVFLCVPHDSKTLLAMGKCDKITAWFYRYFIVLKLFGSSAYHLHVPNGVKVHPIFYVIHLKELLS